MHCRKFYFLHLRPVPQRISLRLPTIHLILFPFRSTPLRVWGGGCPHVATALLRPAWGCIRPPAVGHFSTEGLDFCVEQERPVAVDFAEGFRSGFRCTLPPVLGHIRHGVRSTSSVVASRCNRLFDLVETWLRHLSRWTFLSYVKVQRRQCNLIEKRSGFAGASGMFCRCCGGCCGWVLVLVGMCFGGASDVWQ